jgi:hypothetical protein
MNSLTTIAVLLGAVLGQAFGGEGVPQGAPAGQVILDESSYWRCFYTWQTPVRREDNAQIATPTKSWAAQTQPPPAEWIKPDFSDGQWGRWRRAKPRDRVYDYGFRSPYGSPGPSMALQCLRGRFKVEDPAKVQGMTLALEYRGGAVVYLNGKELARGHLPKEGKIEPLALAEDYPTEAFLRPDGQLIMSEFSNPKTYRDRVEKRIRKLEAIAIKSEDLRKGINVLAVESHRAPYIGTGLERECEGCQSVWSTAGLVSLELRAAAGAEPNLARPKGVQVWNTSVVVRTTPYEHADPFESLGPVVIPAARNGSFTGKLMVSSESALRGVKAESADLVHKDCKARIPASAVKVLYAIRDNRPLCRYASPAGGFWDTLVETPPAEQAPGDKGAGAMQPIWVKVKVPPDALPGEYQGKLTISVSGATPVEAPVRLTVADWKLPDSKDFTGGHLTFIQSPDTLALFYKVPMWSEEHWKLIEESFKLMGEIGNRYVVIPLICRTNFGNAQSMVRWVKDGEGVKPEFSVFDRYLDLAQKYMKPDVVCLDFWDRYTGESMHGGPEHNWGPTLVTRLDPATGKGEDMAAPVHGSPESKAFWEPACKEIRARLEKRGLLGVTMMGINGDYYTPSQPIANMLVELMPGMKWVSNAHEDKRGGVVCKVLPVGYNTAVYIKPCPPPPGLTWDEKRQVGWRLVNKADWFPRGGIGHSVPLGNYRLVVEFMNYDNYSGVGRVGFDFWPVGTGGSNQVNEVKRSLTVNGRYPPSWDQLQVDITAENVTSPGPNGALPTERFENMREGMQEMEARAFVEKAVITPALRAKLGEELAKKCQQVLDERHWRVYTAWGSSTAFELADAEPFREELYNLAAEVAAKLGGK